MLFSCVVVAPETRWREMMIRVGMMMMISGNDTNASALAVVGLLLLLLLLRRHPDRALRARL